MGWLAIYVPGVMTGRGRGLPGPELGPEAEEVRLVLGLLGVLLPEGVVGLVGGRWYRPAPHLTAAHLPLGGAAVDHRALDTVAHDPKHQQQC